MAKINSITMDGVQGTLQGVTFVKSKRYGAHIRSKRGTVKPAIINDALVASKKRLLQANELAAPVFYAIRDEHKDGSLWSRLLSAFRKQIKEGGKPGMHCLLNLECSEDHRLDRIIGRPSYSITVQKQKKKMDITVQLQYQPQWKRIRDIERYQLGVVVVYTDFKKGYSGKEVAYDDLTALKNNKKTFQFQIPVPAKAKEYALFLKITGCSVGRSIIPGGSHYVGMRVADTGTVK